MTKERTGSGPRRLGAELELELGLGTSPQFCPLWPVILFSENGSRCLTATVQSRSTKKIQLPISVLWVLNPSVTPVTTTPVAEPLELADPGT